MILLLLHFLALVLLMPYLAAADEETSDLEMCVFNPLSEYRYEVGPPTLDLSPVESEKLVHSARGSIKFSSITKPQSTQDTSPLLISEDEFVARQ